MAPPVPTANVVCVIPPPVSHAAASQQGPWVRRVKRNDSASFAQPHKDKSKMTTDPVHQPHFITAAACLIQRRLSASLSRQEHLTMPGQSCNHGANKPARAKVSGWRLVFRIELHRLSIYSIIWRPHLIQWESLSMPYHTDQHPSCPHPR